MENSEFQERFERACAVVANTEYTIDATVKTELGEVVIIPRTITTIGLKEIEKEFDSCMYSSLFGGFVVGDF